MTTIILDKIKPNLIAKLQSLAQQNSRTLEEEITVILENVAQNQKVLQTIHDNISKNDPLLPVIGIFDSQSIKSDNIDQELY